MTTGVPLLSVRNIETWYGPVNAIKGVSLDVEEGRIVAVLGGFMVLFGTGIYLQPTDPSPPYQRQSFYGIWDRNDGSTVSGRGVLQPQHQRIGTRTQKPSGGEGQLRRRSQALGGELEAVAEVIEELVVAQDFAVEQ